MHHGKIYHGKCHLPQCVPHLIHVCTCVSVIPDFKNELVAAAVGERVLNSADVRGATPKDEVTKHANKLYSKTE